MQFRNEGLVFIDVLYAIIGLVYPGLQGNGCGIHLTSSFEQEPLIGT